MINDLVDKIRWYKPRILIVDDMLHNIKLLNSFFDLHKIDVLPAYNAEQAIDIVNNQKVDLILLDVAMPGIDGFSLCQMIKSDNKIKEIPIIFLTAKNNVEDIVRGFEIGANDYITKPFNPQELLARVFAQLEIRYSKEVIKIQNDELIHTRNQLFEEAMKVVAMNEQVYDSEAKFKSLNTAKDKLFSIIAHDLKGPLSSLKSQIEMMTDYFDTLSKEDIKESLFLMKESSLTVFSLLENLLVWSRNQLGKIEYSPEIYFIKFVINDAVSYLNKFAAKKNITIINNIDEELELFFDISMINFVFKNLIHNAIKYSSKNSQIEIFVKEDNADYASISVKDYGCGLSGEEISKLFDIDSENIISSNSKSLEKGTGLGLVLCKEFMEKNSGSISVISELEKGSEFIIKFNEK